MNPSTIAANITRLALDQIARSTELSEEIGHFLTVQTENDEYSGKPGHVDAVFQALQLAEHNEHAAMLKLCRRLLIAAGFYRVMPQEEIDRTYVTSGKQWDFRLDGVSYAGDHTFQRVTEASLGSIPH